MTVNQAQKALNKAYFAMMKAPKLNQDIENAYWEARDNLHIALRIQRTQYLIEKLKNKEITT